MYDIDCIGTLCTPFVLRPSNYDESVIDFIDISYSDIELALNIWIWHLALDNTSVTSL